MENQENQEKEACKGKAFRVILIQELSNGENKCNFTVLLELKMEKCLKD